MARAAAAAAVLALALLGALDLSRLIRDREGTDTPPGTAREISFEPGVDWRPVKGGSQ